MRWQTGEIGEPQGKETDSHVDGEGMNGENAAAMRLSLSSQFSQVTASKS
jgi:hypothetical protein